MSLLRYSLFAALLLALSHGTSIEAASTTMILDNLVTLPIAKHFNSTGSGKILQHDQARARSLRDRAIARATGTPPPSSEVGSVPITNQIIAYTAFVSHEGYDGADLRTEQSSTIGQNRCTANRLYALHILPKLG